MLRFKCFLFLRSLRQAWFRRIPQKQKLHISIHSVSDLNLHFKYSSSHERKNGTEAKPNKKFITSKVLQQRSLYQFLVGDIDTNIRSTLKLVEASLHNFYFPSFSLSLSRFGGHGTRFMGKQKSTFYSTFFRYILWEKKHFFVAVRSYSIMFDTMHNKFAGSSFQFEIDTEEKSCSIDSCSEKRQFLIPFVRANEADLNFKVSELRYHIFLLQHVIDTFSVKV